MGESDYHQRQADHNLSQFGAYDYRTRSAQDAANAAREREAQSWHVPDFTSGGSGGGGVSSGSGDGWTAIASLLLIGFGLFALYHAAIFVFEVYRHGASPYPYFFQAISRDASALLVGIILAFVVAQVLPYFAFVRWRGWLTALIYVALVPAVTVTLAELGFLTVGWVAPHHDLSGWLTGISAALPGGFEVATGVWADTIRDALPFYLAGTVVAIVAFFVLREILRYLGRGVAILIRALRSGYERAQSSIAGKAVLVVLSWAVLVLCSQIVVPDIRVPLGIHTAPFILIGLICGWRIATIATALWVLAAVIGLPVVAADLSGSAELRKGYAGLMVGIVAAAAVSGLRGDMTRLGPVFLLAVAADIIFIGIGAGWMSYWAEFPFFDLLFEWLGATVLGLGLNAVVATTVFVIGERLAAAPFAVPRAV